MIKVLDMDDDPLEGEAMHFLLQKERPKIQFIGQALSGRVGINMAKKMKPHIAFVDIKMPGINGITAIKLLKELDPGIKIVVVSAYNEFEFARKALTVGADYYLLKPVRPQEILRVLDSLCEDLSKPALSQNQAEQPIFSIDCDKVSNKALYERIAEQVQFGELKKSRELVKHFWEGLKASVNGNMTAIRSGAVELAGTVICLSFEKSYCPDTLTFAYHSFINGIKNAQTVNNIETCLKEFIENGSKIFNQYTNDTGHELISHAKELIQMQLHKNITLEYIAQELHLSPYYFSRLFKEKAGVNFIDYVIEHRLEKAMLALSTTNDTVASIAKTSGYYEVNSFSRLFKKRLGMSPSEFRALNNKRTKEHGNAFISIKDHK